MNEVCREFEKIRLRAAQQREALRALLVKTYRGGQKTAWQKKAACAFSGLDHVLSFDPHNAKVAAQAAEQEERGG